ncbi:hypothetical protein IJT17_09840 [bacterium]|nr:hypothetical protein [bacterium]
MQSFIYYAQFDDFWNRLEPLTPYGKDLKQERTLYYQADDLEKLWEAADCAAQLLDNGEINLSRIRYFLKRLPRFRCEALSCYDEADIFEYKKFISNYHQLTKLLPQAQRDFFGLSFTSQPLEELLSRGEQYMETFYVDDAYSEELAEVRRQIRDTDRQLQEAEQSCLRQIEETLGWSFAGEFAVVTKAEVHAVSAAKEEQLSLLVTLEPFDSERFIVRPRLPGTHLALQEQRQKLAGQERQAEATILSAISAEIRSELPLLLRYRQSVCALDFALARAKLARQYDLVRPTITAEPSAPLLIEGGRFIPCAEHCASLGTAYVPLDWRLDRQQAVLFGSNMGGKTIALKTLAFLQLCVQTGLYVPAKHLQTCLFKHFHYIGEGRRDTPQQGLSGFGYEMSQFCQAYACFDEPTLVLFDEFARTTNSREAEALISAILADMAEKTSVRAVFSSHFHGIQRQPQTAFFKMRGLRRDTALEEQAKQETPEQRLMHISALIDYRIQPDPQRLESSDALAIAALLGVPAAITEFAKKQLCQGQQ